MKTPLIALAHSFLSILWNSLAYTTCPTHNRGMIKLVATVDHLIQNPQLFLPSTLFASLQKKFKKKTLLFIIYIDIKLFTFFQL